MLFNSLSYAIFLPAVVLVHWLLPRSLRALFLLVASYVFYAAWNPRYLPLILGLTLVNHRLGLWLTARRGTDGETARIAIAVGVNLAALGVFKYSALAVTTFDRLARFAHLPQSAQFPVPELVLPLGISFFVFEFVHYVVDVSRGDPPERSLLRFALFAAFFPTQIAGPIKRYQSFVPQLDERPRLDLDRFATGTVWIARGLFKKMALADNLAPLAARGFDAALPGAHGLPPCDAALTLIAFAAQIYCDFSGYTDIGRGSARLLGFDVPENFRAPYLATSISEFWRHWHISLSSWLRDYVYVPLGGRERKRSRNLFATMVLGGLWHGASWKFAVWGAFHGTALVGYWAGKRGHSSFSNRDAIPPSVPATSKMRNVPFSLLGWVATIMIVLVGWAFFRAGSTYAAVSLIADLVGRSTSAPATFFSFERQLILAIACGGLSVQWLVERGVVPLRWQPALGTLRLAAVVVLLALALLFRPVVGVRFIYFQF